MSSRTPRTVDVPEKLLNLCLPTSNEDNNPVRPQNPVINALLMSLPRTSRNSKEKSRV